MLLGFGKELSNLKPSWNLHCPLFFFKLGNICKAIQHHIFVDICCISMYNVWRPKLTVFSCSSGSSTSAGAARWRATAAPSASRGTGLPTRSSVGSARGFWPWSRNQSDDLPSPSPGRGGWKGGWGASGIDLFESSGDEVQPGAEMLTRDNVGCLKGWIQGEAE